MVQWYWIVLNVISNYHWEYHWVLLKYHWMVQLYWMVFIGIPLALFCKGRLDFSSLVLQRSKIDGFFLPIHILNQGITSAASPLYRGIMFDKHINFKQICHWWFYHIRDLRRYRRYISLSVAKCVATGLISSKVDYCDRILYNLATKDIPKRSRVQHCLVRQSCVSLASKSKDHWLPNHYILKITIS